jgi:ribosomal protein S27AE
MLLANIYMNESDFLKSILSTLKAQSKEQETEEKKLCRVCDSNWIHDYEDFIQCGKCGAVQ